MEWKDALLDIVKDSGSRIRLGEPLAKHTYFGIGGEATAYIEVSTVSQLAALARFPSTVGGSSCHHRPWLKSAGERHRLQRHRYQVNRGVGETTGRWERRFGRRRSFAAETLKGDVSRRSEWCGICARYPRFRRRCIDYERRRMGKQFRRCPHRCHGHD